MAGDWIKMRTNLDSDPRVIEMASILEVDELHVVGMLHKIWAWADSHTLEGNAIRVTCVTLDRFTRCNGFADALRKVGWLDGRDNAITFPRFVEHNGQTAKKRAETNKRVAKHRNAKSVTSVTQKALPEKRREEKRREEKEYTHTPSAFSDRWSNCGMPERFDQFRAQFESWDGCRRYEGRLIPFEPMELQAQALSLAREKLSDDEICDLLSMATAGGWKSVNVDLWRRKRIGKNGESGISFLESIGKASS